MECEKEYFLWKINLEYWKDITKERGLKDCIELKAAGIVVKYREKTKDYNCALNLLFAGTDKF